MSSAIDKFLDHPLWCDTHRSRLVPLGEDASISHYSAGDRLFQQFHPAEIFALISGGSVGHETSEDEQGDAWPMGRVSWPWAALGWSGFLPPFRNGTTARANTQVELICWRHEDLARIFYADPALSVDFLRLVLDSVRRQFESVRGERLATRRHPQLHHALFVAAGPPAQHRFAPSLLTALRRSAFFEQFEDGLLEKLAHGAQPKRHESSAEVVRQGEAMDGLLVLAAGEAHSYFSAIDSTGERLDRFRTIPAEGGILAGIPTINGAYRAEGTVITASTCWVYEIPKELLNRLTREDPEFGRAFMQRQLARLAHLISAARVPRPSPNDEPEIVAVKSILNQNQARIPVTSELYKLPHLLSHRLTIANAMACLRTVREKGRYAERAIAGTCTDLLTGLRAELHFYRDVLEAYTAVAEARSDTPPPLLRIRCDEMLARGFDHLSSEIRDLKHLPKTAGNIVIMNHLGCPAYYELPNHYHFSFDTAFVSVLLNAYYDQSPVRVVRQSPGAEYGHNLFYSRLGHITVPTIESGIEGAREMKLEELRRDAAETFFSHGQEVLAQGQNLLICPEGQSQPPASSPAKFYSGAFRLALKAEEEPLIVPIAVAGFDRRYKDSKLVACVQKPFRVRDAMRKSGTDDLREFLDQYRSKFARAVKRAQQLSATSAACSPVFEQAAPVLQGDA